MRANNYVQLLGNLGGDPKNIKTNSNVSMCAFSLATNETYRDHNGEKIQSTVWHDIVCFGKVADIAVKNLKKSNKVLVNGSLQKRKYQAQDGTDRIVTEIKCELITFL